MRRFLQELALGLEAVGEVFGVTVNHASHGLVSVVRWIYRNRVVCAVVGSIVLWIFVPRYATPMICAAVVFVLFFEEPPTYKPRSSKRSPIYTEWREP